MGFEFKNFIGNFIDSVVNPALDRKMREAGQDWVNEARELVPVDTGQLRDSIGYIYDQDRKKLLLYADKYYAVFVEWGTRYKAAHPFMRPALKAIRRRWGINVELQLPMTPPKYVAKAKDYIKTRTPVLTHLGHLPPVRKRYRK